MDLWIVRLLFAVSLGLSLTLVPIGGAAGWRPAAMASAPAKGALQGITPAGKTTDIAAPAEDYIPLAERAALVALYNSTGGANWKNRAEIGRAHV